MPVEYNIQINAFIDNHLEKIKQVASNQSEELRILQLVVDQKKLTLEELMVLGSVGDSALDLRGVKNTAISLEESHKNLKSPIGIDFDFDSKDLKDKIPLSIVEQQVRERIFELEEMGVNPAPLPEINPINMLESLSSLTNYIVKSIAIPSVTEILAARKNPEDARTFAQILNVIADEVFEVISAGGDMMEMPSNAVNRMFWGGGTFIAAKITDQMGMESDKPTKLALRAISQNAGIEGVIAASVATYVGGRLGLSKDDSDNLGNVAIATIQSGSLSSGFARASEKVMFKEMWKRSGGIQDLKDINLSKAKDKYFFSKEAADTAMNCFSAGVEIVSEAAKQSISASDPSFGGFILGSITKEVVKLGAQGLLLGSLVALKNYFTTYEVSKAQNPELIADTLENITLEEKRITRESPRLNSSVREVIREEEINISLDNKAKERQWKDIIVAPKALKDNEELLKEVMKAAAPAVKVMSYKREDYVELHTGKKKARLTPDKKR